jgi:hypothetical protein
MLQVPRQFAFPCIQHVGNAAYFFSSPGGDFGPPTLSIPGSIFSAAAGAGPVISGDEALESGMVAAGDLSGVVF